MSRDKTRKPLWQLSGWVEKRRSGPGIVTEYAQRLPEGELYALRSYAGTKDDAAESYTIGLLPPEIVEQGKTAYELSLQLPIFPSDMEEDAVSSSGFPTIFIGLAKSKGRSDGVQIIWSPLAGKLIECRSKFYTLPHSFVKVIKPVLQHPERLEVREERIKDQLSSIDDLLRQEGINPDDVPP